MTDLDIGLNIHVYSPLHQRTQRQFGRIKESPMRRSVVAIGLLAVSLFVCDARVTSQTATAPAASLDIQSGVPRSECLPESRLPADLRAKSEALLLLALDHEALYTLVTGLKPMSDIVLMDPSGYPTIIRADPPNLPQVEEYRRLLSAWTCGNDVYAGVLVAKNPQRGYLQAQMEVVSLPAITSTLERHATFFGSFGLTRSVHPMQLLSTIAAGEVADRMRSSGYLYGYPDYAVDFFVDAAQSRAKMGQGSPSVPRDFINVPTFAEPETAFTWAVPKGHVETDEDKAIKARASAILDAYKLRRARYIGPGKPGAFSLLRDWYCSSGPRCSPSGAKPN